MSSSNVQAPTTGTSSRSKFTALMQDRQARNKDPYTGLPHEDADLIPENEKSPIEPSSNYLKGRSSSQDDGYDARERRRMAAAILDSPEIIMMHAQARGDSIPGTRHHFMKILCGFDEPDRKEKERAKEKYKGGRF